MTRVSYRPLVLIGPSGAGKSTVAEQLACLPDVQVVPTITTRPVRPSEGTLSHAFVTQQAFDTMKRNGAFIGTTHMFGHDYGLPKLPTTHDQLILLLRAPFVAQFKASYPDSIIIQLEAPLPVLQNRLTQRGNPDRTDEATLEKEMILGRSVADTCISTDQPLTDCVDAIIARLTEI